MSRTTWAAVGALAVLGAFTVPQGVAAQAGRSHVREGNELYEQGRFDEAHQKYLEALREDPGSGLVRFNDGNALYKSEDFQRAMEAYRRAAESGDPSLVSSAWYNLGNAFFRAQQLEQSLEAYKQALRSYPGDQDAKHNLERVLERMQQQQQDQQGRQQDQDQEQDQPDQPQPDQPQQDQPQSQQGQEQGDQQQDSGQPQPTDGEDGGEQERQEPRPGQMTRDEAERLLDAFSEDPGDVNRKPVLPPRDRKPVKDW